MVLYLLFWSLTAPVPIHFIIWEICGHDRKPFNFLTLMHVVPNLYGLRYSVEHADIFKNIVVQTTLDPPELH